MTLFECRKLTFLFVFFLCLTNSEVFAAQNQCSSNIPKHDSFAGLLARYAPSGQVDYRLWFTQQVDRRALTDYIQSLGKYCKDDFQNMPKSAQLAMLLNLYNAATIEWVFRHYPIQSITDIKRGSIGSFDVKWIEVSWGPEDKISLNQLENELIRPWFQDPRIHFALVCAAESCPKLLSQPYRSKQVYSQLENQTKLFFRDSRQVEYDDVSRTMTVSKIFEWYKLDFVSDAGSLAQYLSRELKKATGKDVVNRFQIRFHHYSWALNQAR